MNLIIAYARTKPAGNAVATALFGIAALNLIDGATIHSVYKVPTKNLNSNSTSSLGMAGTEPFVELLLSSKANLFDEASMTHINIYKVIERALQLIWDNNKLVAGTCMCLAGDWRQILPICVNGTQGHIVASTFKKSKYWRHCIVKHLTINQRVENCKKSGDIELAEKLDDWSKYLERIGDGKETTYPNLGVGNQIIKLPSNIVSDSKNLNEFVNEIYPDFETHHDDEEYLMNRVIITSLNEQVDAINDIMLNKLGDEDCYTYEAADTAIDSELGHLLSPSLLVNEKRLPNGFPPTVLKLKVGCPIMILRNIDPKNGACNGTRAIITKCGRYFIEARIAVGAFKDRLVTIHRIDTTSDWKDGVIQTKRRQFPIRLAYAMTIHKSQGQTLARCGLYLPAPLFTHGQLYVALSRVGNPDHISVCVKNTKCPGKLVEQSDDTYTRNVVYTELFDDDDDDDDIDVEMRD